MSFTFGQLREFFSSRNQSLIIGMSIAFWIFLIMSTIVGLACLAALTGIIHPLGCINFTWKSECVIGYLFIGIALTMALLVLVLVLLGMWTLIYLTYRCCSQACQEAKTRSNRI